VTTAAVQVRLPRLLADLIGGQRAVEAAGDDVGSVLDDLCTRHPELRVHLFDGAEIRRHVNLFLNDEIVRWRPGVGLAVAPGDEVVVVQAVSGGH